ncbi:MAG: sigma-54-dependent Fis family transcriptional regulator [Nitrospirae bacterium]|nr:sigma-54-dependent Fis family transcriptional regulator [Nitrospirota bacterium]
MKPILVVDDDPNMRNALKGAVSRLGYKVLVADNGRDALSTVNSTPVSMVVTDMMMPKMDGLTFLKEIRQKIGSLPVLVITGYPTIENAVETMKEGATDYLIKPFDFDTLTKKIDSMMMRFHSKREMITDSPKLKHLLGIAENVAASDTTVLIYGESGTGKELLARHIHQISGRRDKPFVAVNCAAIPDNLMESELFGFEKGAFTGASEKKLGKFELADSGTILLDEIGEMTMPLQAKLLRVLQEKEVDRIGGKEPVSINVRIVATTNRDLYKEAQEGRFREDLYYRLSVFPLQLPPLRDRAEDIVMLAEHFMKKYAAELLKNVNSFSVEALEFLKTRQWRGNIRELENTINRAVLLSRSQCIEVNDFMVDSTSQSAAGAQSSVVQHSANPTGLRNMERDMILKTLEDVGGNKTKAAKILGVSVRTIRNKLHEYGVKSEAASDD